MDDKSERNKKPDTGLGFVKTTQRDQGYRRAAEFLLLLGKDEALKVLTHLSENEVEGVMKEIATIERIEAKSGNKLLREFGYFTKTKDAVTRGGIEKAREMLSAVFSEEKVEDILFRIQRKQGPPPFSFLMDIELDKVKLLLKNESLPAIALVLPYLEASRASKILAGFPLIEQKEIVARIARLELIDSDIIWRVEEVLRKKIRTMDDMVTDEIDGEKTLVDILKHMDEIREKQILNELQETDPELVAAIEHKRFDIHIIHQLPDRDLQTVLAEYSDRELALIVKSIEKAEAERILSNVSSRRREAIEGEVAFLGRTHRSESSKAINEFLNYIKLQADQGIITVQRLPDQYIQ